MAKVLKNRVFVILDNIRSKQNVGSIFRTSDASGVSKVYLCGTTPCPVDRFNRDVGEISKTALGAEKSVNWEYSKTTNNLIKKLKKEEFYVIALEQSKNSVDYKKINLRKYKRVAIILGNEVRGIQKSTLKLCDIVVEISMLGNKESLNVSVAYGVAMFRMLNI